METINQILARELGREQQQIDNVITLLDEGNTIPFIARYRKELHGAMDDAMLRTLAERLEYLRNLQERRDAVKKSISDQGKLTEELEQEIDNAETLARLEDVYRPYKQKRRTRATAAKEKGLEPLALALYAQTRDLQAPEIMAEAYVDPEKGVNTAEEALQGASDIVAEMISDDAAIRAVVRELIRQQAELVSAAAKEEDSVYRLYYEFRRPVSRVQGHQVLAINRGEKEEYLHADVELDREAALQRLRRAVIIPGNPASAFMRSALEDAYDRLIWPSMERETRAELTDTACEGAIRMFGANLKPLLMQPPVKGKVTMSLDPGYTHGCKVAVVDETGKVLDTAVVYPTTGDRKKEDAIRTLSALIRKYGVRAIAIGNGTASRETEAMAAEMLERLHMPDLAYAIVNEAGASVYSATALAAEELPGMDVNLRSAVSLARRLQDPLAELVKIEPMAIGVGQYQHDMPQAKLEETLDGVVEDCVNAVGVDINTASPALLQRVSGLTKTTARNIVAYREENGPFTGRKQITKVPKLGPKAYQQCAGFLRIPGGKLVLDNTAVHPESYDAAEKLLQLCGYTMKDVAAGKIGELKTRYGAQDKVQAVAVCGVGEPTLQDIVTELMKPGRDIREELPPVVLRKDVLDISDLKPGMILTGTVRNVIDFGVFVDIGVHQDGLVHISRISDKFIRHPGELLSVGDIVKVKVLEVDEKKHRISLSMRDVKE